jgi:hypothetical protein
MARLELIQYLPADLGTKFLGIALASASAAFPFYIYNNPERFGPPRMEYAAVDSEGSEGEVRKARFQEGGPSILAEVALDQAEAGTIPSSSLPESANISPGSRPELDGVMTGTVALPRPRQTKMRQAPPEQPFPGDLEPVNLLFVSAGGALVMDEGGIEIVGEGSDLPDGSRVLSIRLKDGEWEILTTGERVLRWRKS